jgi:hypothetical protein
VCGIELLVADCPHIGLIVPRRLIATQRANVAVLRRVATPDGVIDVWMRSICEHLSNTPRRILICADLPYNPYYESQ